MRREWQSAKDIQTAVHPPLSICCRQQATAAARLHTLSGPRLKHAQALTQDELACTAARSCQPCRPSSAKPAAQCRNCTYFRLCWANALATESHAMPGPWRLWACVCLAVTVQCIHKPTTAHLPALPPFQREASSALKSSQAHITSERGAHGCLPVAGSPMQPACCAQLGAAAQGAGQILRQAHL